MNKNKNAVFNKNSKENLVMPGYNEVIPDLMTSGKISNSEEIEKRESELNMRELKFIAKQLLTEKKLPVELAEILKLEDEESIAQAVEMLSKLVGEKENDERLKVLDEKKLPESKAEEIHTGKLRKAFGLI